MKKFISTENNVEFGYETAENGTYIDADGDIFEGMPGIVAHDTEWAEIAVEVCGGYMVFDCRSEYELWARQE